MSAAKTLASSPPSPSSKRPKKALLIGINQYPQFPRKCQLDGAVNDVESLAALLRGQFDFPDDAVEILTDSQATRSGMVEAFGRLLDRTQEGDSVLVHYSGHGSRRRCGDNPYRSDRWENVLVPYDSSHEGTRPNRDISGAELYAWLRHLSAKTPRVTLILDCCHAGTLPRDQSGTQLGRVRTVLSDDRPTPHERFPWSEQDRQLPRPHESGWLPASSAYTLIAACQRQQKARELTLREQGVQLHHGALTAALLQALPVVAEATYRELLPLITQTVQSRFDDQHPQIEGAIDRQLFRLQEQAPRREALVASCTKDRLVFAAGVIQGVTPGSTWAIHAADDVQNRAPPIGRARVLLVSGARSDAAVLPGTDFTQLGVGCRLIEEERGLACSALPIALEVPPGHSAWRSALAAAIDRAPALRLAADPSQAELRVAVLSPRPWPIPTDLAPSLGAVAQPLCVVLNQRGHVVAPVHPLSDPLTSARTMENLEKLARAQRLRALDNPRQTPLHGRVGVRLLQRNPEGLWVDAKEHRGECPRFDHGEGFCLSLTNQAPKPVHLFIVDLGVGGGISLIYPLAGATEPLAPGKEVIVGQRHGDERSFEIPPSLPYDDPGTAPWSGDEFLKIFVTEEATDLSLLFQGSLRTAHWKAQGTETKLSEALASILSNGHREVQAGPSPRTVAWTAQRLRVTLRRPSN